MTSHPSEIQRECRHSQIEHLGNDYDTRFYRCEGCRQILVVQGALMLAFPSAAQLSDSTLDD